jgi:hypothetical protein
MTILEVDLTGVYSDQGARDLADKVYKLVKMYRAGELLIMYNFGSFKFNSEFVKFIIPRILEAKKKITRRALITTDMSQGGFIRDFCQLMKISHNTEFFNEETKAMNWLVRGEL